MRITLPRIGLGGAPLGNMFHPLSEETADATLNAAWDAGFRYYDVSPHYGAGLAEQRFGRMLSGKPRDEYVLSTKVGRLLQPAGQPETPSPSSTSCPTSVCRIIRPTARAAPSRTAWSAWASIASM